MAVISLAELKARFATADRPTQKDFDDLIDTLTAASGSAVPSGAAGGDLDGTYPNPTVAPGAVTLAKFQDITSGKLLGRYSALTGSPEQIGVGAGLSISGSDLVWTGGGGGGGGAGTVAGAISSFTSDPIDLPAVDGDLALVQAPTTFGATLPQAIRVVAVVTAAFAGYVAGDEIPLEYFRDKSFPETPCFQVVSYVTGGQVTVKIKVEYGSFVLATGFAVYARDLTTGPDPAITLYPFPGAVDHPQDFMYIRVYMARYAPGTGLGSVALFEPTDQAMPAATGNVATFTHNYGDPPSFPVMVNMVCVIADAATGHALGDMVPAILAFDGSFNRPAFGITNTSSTIEVRRFAGATLTIPHKATAAITAITANANWQIRVRTAKGVNLPSIQFPALTYQVSNPMHAWTYNNLMFIANYDMSFSHTYLSVIDMTTNAVTNISDYSGPFSAHGNVSMFRMVKAGVPVDCIFVCEYRGIFRIDMDDLSQTQLITGDYHHNKVLDVDEAVSPGLFAYPKMLIANNTHGTSHTWGAMSPRLLIRNAGNTAYLTDATPAEITWSTLTGIGGALYSMYQVYDQQGQSILLFQYNKIKKRIYMIHNGSGYLNIFKLTAPAPTLMTWWDSVPDGTQLEFERMLAIPGGGDTWNDTNTDHYFVEHDGVTGAEKCIVVVRRGNNDLTGSVCRIPWNEPT